MLLCFVILPFTKYKKKNINKMQLIASTRKKKNTKNHKNDYEVKETCRVRIPQRKRERVHRNTYYENKC